MGFDNLQTDLLFCIFSYLSSVRDLCVCATVSKHWRRTLEDNEYVDAWSLLLEDLTPEEFRKTPLIQKIRGAKAKLVSFANAWNDIDCSQNIFLLENKITLHRKPIAQCTDAIRGKCGYSSGQHYWTVRWHGPKLGSVASVGVATKEEVLQKNGYVNLLGRTCESWGWDVSHGVLWHDGKKIGKYPNLEKKVKVEVGQCIGVTLDLEDRTLSFDLNGFFLGVAFRMLPPQRFYPAISAVYGNSEISMVYEGVPLVG